ncbi:MAG: hypothetical protein U9Q85_02410 [Patescibacteria group bacterium]|nr:hypothetical protein [Patescibacteria group bacterium]
MLKLLKFLPIILFLFVFALDISVVEAQSSIDDLIGLNDAEDLGLPGSDITDIKQTAVDIIKYLIGFLGIIATAIILYGGFIWMTATGNDDRIKKAKSIIIGGVIGLAVVLASYAIVSIIATVVNDAVDGNL